MIQNKQKKKINSLVLFVILAKIIKSFFGTLY